MSKQCECTEGIKSFQSSLPRPSTATYPAALALRVLGPDVKLLADVHDKNVCNTTALVCLVDACQLVALERENTNLGVLRGGGCANSGKSIQAYKLNTECGLALVRKEPVNLRPVCAACMLG